MKDFNKITPDDPRLTAFALGEITDAEEKTAIEQAIATDSQLAAFVEEVQATADLLGEAFSEETKEGSAPFPQDASSASKGRDAWPQASADASSFPVSKKIIRFPAWLGLAAAAAVAATIGGLTVLNDESNVPEVGQLAPRNIEVTTLAEEETAKEAPAPKPESKIVGLNAPEFEEEVDDKAELEFSTLDVAPDQPMLSFKDVGNESNIIILEEVAVDEIQPAARPKVSVPLSPVTVAQSEPVQSRELQILKPAEDGQLVAGNIGYQSEYIFRGKQMEEAQMQSSLGLSAGSGTKGDTTLYANSSYTQPTGNDFTTADVELQGRFYDMDGLDSKKSNAENWSAALKESDAMPKPQAAPPPPAEVAEARSDISNISSAEETSTSRSSAETIKPKLMFASNGWQRPENQQTRPASPEALKTYGLVPAPEQSVTAPQPDYRAQRERTNTEGYLPVTDNAFTSPLVEPLSTFSIDVDTASYANVRRFIEQGQLPPPDAVRIEELVNYFPYDYPAPGPESEHPLAVYLDAAPAPWNPEHRLVRIGMKAKEVAWEERPASNLVFLLDVSGSMNRPNKLPLVKDALAKLIRRLDERDRVAIVVYAGASGLVLPSTTANNQETISHALNNLKAGGSTNGGDGMKLAYKIAEENLLEEGNNRIILCTDGDFNVGSTDKGEIADLAAAHAKNGVYLTVLGFGMGNYKDDMLENLSNKGNGNYAYIDSEKEARKVFVEQAAGTLLTVAKDVKIQVEFNPAAVQAYRLIGYENRILAARDFNDDKKDAGEVGAGHTVTALYEIVPVGADILEIADIDPLKYQSGGDESGTRDADRQLSRLEAPGEMLTVKMRYKLPDEDTSTKLEFPLQTEQVGDDFTQAATDFRFAAAVAEFGMVLRNSPHKGTSTLTESRDIAEGALSTDSGGYRSDFIELVEKAIRAKGGE